MLATNWSIPRKLWIRNAQKMKFSIKDFFGITLQYSHLLKKFLMESFIFCAVSHTQPSHRKVLIIEFCSLVSLLILITHLERMPEFRKVLELQVLYFSLPLQTDPWLFFFIIFSNWHSSYLLKLNHNKVRVMLWNTLKVINQGKLATSLKVVFMSLLLTLNTFHTFTLFLLLTKITYFLAIL